MKTMHADMAQRDRQHLLAVIAIGLTIHGFLTAGMADRETGAPGLSDRRVHHGHITGDRT